MSADPGLWPYPLELGIGVVSARESVLGKEDRSTHGPASDIRGTIKDFLERCQDGRRGFEAT